MIYKNESITVEVKDTMVTITKDGELMKAESFSNYNEAEEHYKEICEQVDDYVKRQKL